MGLALAAGARAQMPDQPAVVSGTVNIATAGPRMTVNQSTKYGIINWNSFSIGAGNTVHFNNGTGATLNLVTGLTASQIDGTLSATGSLYLLNRNGIIIGPGGQVLTGGNFVASTLDLKDADFLDGGGFTLFGDSPNGVTNLGRISSTGGDVLLAGYTVKNSGTITAGAGRVGLAAGTTVDVLTDVSWLEGSFAVSLGERGNDVTNEGRIQAMIAELRTHNGNIYALAGNNDGLIQATGVENQGGRVVLTADGGTVQSSGTIRAQRDGNGGDIVIAAGEIDNYGGTQDVSGAQGGTIRLDADSIVTDTAILARGTQGAGGTIAIEAANELLFTSAGLVDASGANAGGEIAFGSDAGVMAISGQVNATSSAGAGGRVSFLGKSISLLGASVDASGATGGGSILVGGGFQGGDVWAKPADALLKNSASSQQTYISDRTTLRADATGAHGDGGKIVAWSDGTTQFAGTISARGGKSGGDGGTVETSGVAGLGSSGTVDASASGGGKKGTWLLDPKNITIGTITDPLTQFQTLVGQFGGYSTDNSAYLDFGLFLDISGSMAVVGTHAATGSGSGAVYVYDSGQIVARLTGSGTSTFFGAGVGIEGNFVAVMDPQESILHTPFNLPSYSTTGAVHLYYKGSGWHNGSANQIARLYDNNNRDGLSSQWGFAGNGVGSLNNQRFATMTDANGIISIVVGNPLWDWSYTDGGAVAFYSFSPDAPPSGDITNWNLITADFTGTPDGLHLGDYVTASKGYIYAGTGTTVTSRQNDLYVYNTNSGSGVTRFPDYFSSMGRPSFMTADGTSLFAISPGAQLYYDTFQWPSADNSLSTVHSDGMGIVALDTSALGGGSSTGAAATVAVDGNQMIVGLWGSTFRKVGIYEKPSDYRWSWGPSGPYAPIFTYSLSNDPWDSGPQTPSFPVAISGNYAVAGLPMFDGPGSTHDRGAVVQFQKTNGTWSFTGNLSPAALYDSSGFGAFGTDAVDGNTIVVADPQYHYVDQSTSGRVYVFENGALAAALSSPVAGLSQFGAGVDIDQNRIAVINSDSQTDWVGVFDRGTGWHNGTANFTSGFLAGSVSGSQGTYRSVSLSGDTLAVGVPSVSGTNAGYVDVFGLTTAGISGFTRLRPSVLAANPGSADNFGYTVAVSGNTIAASYSPNGLTGADGGVFLFENLNNSWATAAQSQITAAGNIYGNDNRGWGVSFGLDGDTLAIGYAPIYTGYARGVYVFQRNGTWAQSTHQVARLSGNGAYFGQTVAVDGNRIAVGSPDAQGTLDPTTGQSFSGSDPIFVYDRFSGWQNGTANLLATLNRGSDNNGTTLGWSLAMSGDTIVAGSRYGSGYGAAVPPVFVFSGPYDFSGRATFTANAGTDLAISATSLANALSGGTDITLQANNDISILAPITVNNPHGDGGALSLFAGRDILVNASIFTDNGDLTLIAGDPRANATYTGTGDKVVVLGRDANNAGVTLNPGTGDILINAADRFENRTGGTSPFVFDATTPGRYLVYAKTPDHTGAPDAANLGADLATPGWSFVYYNTAFSVTNLVPSFLPAGNGFIYAVQPTVAVDIGNAAITYGQTMPGASLSLAGLTLGGSSISGTVFGLGASDLANLVTTGLAGSVSVGPNGYVNAGTYAGGITAVAKTTITSGKVYGVAVTTGAAGDLTVAQATLNVTPDNATRVYHSSDPAFTATYTGFVAGDDASVLDTPVTITSPATLTSAVGSYTLTASGGADNNYLFHVTATGTLTITPYALDLTGLTGVNKTYDATTSASYAGTPVITPYAGDNVALTGTLSATAQFADPNAGTDKAITVSGFGLSGTAAGNYTLVLPTGLTASITPAPLTLTGVTAQNRTYDGTATAATSGTATVTPLGSDGVSLAGAVTATFDNKAVGANKPVTLGGVTLTGAAAGNYVLNLPTLTASIAPLDLDVTGLVAVSHVYNGTTAATLAGAPAISPVAGDDVALTGTATGAFADKNAGTAKPVTVGGLDLTGFDAPNYTLIFPTLFADITRAPLPILGLTGVDRTYDGTTVASYTGIATVDPIAGDSVAVTGRGNASFADKNAGSDKSITITGFGIGGFDAANYYVVQPAGLTASILPRLITVAGITASNKTYDGTTALVTSGTPVFGNLIAGDDALFVVNSPVFSFPNSAAGYYQNVLVSGVSLTGADAANYDTTRLYNLGRSISPAPLTVNGVTAASRVYDGTTTVALSGGSLSDVIGADAVALSTAAATGTLANKNVGAAKAVTASGYALSGAAAGNYVLVQPVGLTTDITAFTLNLVGLSGDKIYDGTRLAPLTFSGLDAVFSGDTVTVDATGVTATYADKNAGGGKAVALAGLFTLSGADAANYLLNQPAGLTGTIARRAITVTGLTIADKVYDGTTAGVISGTGTFGGAIAGDDLSINVGAIDVTFADKNVGTNKAIALSGVTLAGADAGNYTAATPTGITASITAKDLTVTGLAAQDKVYDRTTAATLTGTGTLNGVVAGDAVGLDETARDGSFADKNAGDAKSVFVTGLAVGGADATNYHIVDPVLTASIFRADASVLGLAAVDRVYEGTTVAPLTGTATLDFGSLNGVLVSAEDVALAGSATGTFADKNAGTAKPVTVAGLSLAGADAANYNLLLPSTLTANVTPASLAITGVAVANKTYDATTVASITAAGTVTAFGADVVALATSGATASFADKNAGRGKAVAFSGYALTGTDAANYQLVQPAGITADITPADLVLAGLVADSKTYDGTVAASLGGTLAVQPLGNDQVAVAGKPVGTFADRNAGTDKPVAVTGLSFTGVDAGNYRLVIPNLVADVVQRLISVTGLSAVGRVYDGTAAVALSGTPTLGNLVSGDNVSFNVAALVASLVDKNVGTNKAVTLSGGGLTGADAGNYQAVLPGNLAATITARDLTVGGVAATNRAYDGTTNVALTGGTLQGAVTGDAVQLSTIAAAGTMVDKNVGTDKPVVVGGYAVTGADAGNYQLAQPGGVTVTITPKSLGITGLEVADKFYDGTTAATLSGGTLSGVVSGDDVRLLTGAGQGQFADPDVGNNKPVTPLDLSLAGNDARNYQIDPVLDVRGNILATLATIADVIPADVLHASAEADLAQQRAALTQFNAGQADAIQTIDLGTLTNGIDSGIPVPQVSPAILSLPADQQDAATQAYVAAAQAAQAAATAAETLAQNYTAAAQAYEQLGQSVNGIDRELKTEQGLHDAYVTQVDRAQAELDKVITSLASIEQARQTVADLTAKMAEANRLGRGSEVAAYAQQIAQAQAIIAQEAAVRAQQDSLAKEVQASRDALAASDAKVAQLTAQKDKLSAKLTQAETDLAAAKQRVEAAKQAAADANDKLEVARKLGEGSAVAAVANLDQQLADLKKGGPVGTIDQQVAAVYASAGGTDRASLGMVAATHPLSPERNAAVAAAVADQQAALAHHDALTQKVAALDAVVQNAPALISVQAGAAQRSPALRNLDSAQLAALDIHSLGIKDTDVLPAKSPEVVALKSSSANLQSALAAVATTSLPGAGVLPANVDPSSPLGLAHLDQPLTFSPATEASLKSQMQAFGVLPTFTSPTLANLPLATQLKLNDAMKAMANAQKNGTPADANAIMSAEISKIVMDKVAGDLAGKTGLGDIPGVQAAVGAAVGELAAQYGIDPTAMTSAVLKDPKAALLGAPGDALSAVGGAAKKIVSNPVAAGIDLGTKTYEALKAGGEAFAAAWGGGGAPADPQAAQRAFDAQKAKLATLGGAILGVETQREQLVTERDQALQQARDVMVATKQSTEITSQLGSREVIQQRTDAAIQQVRADAVRAQVTEDITKQNQQHDQAVAALAAQRAAASAKAAAFNAGNTGSGTSGGPGQ